MPCQIAALDYDVLRSTLWNYVMEITLLRNHGRKRVLSTIEEDKVVEYIHGMVRYGYPMSLTELKIKVAVAT